ncbi:MAG: tRNA (guanosine(37)-N1)-methyltransferase TrmD [Lachnospiraceae bacterium]|nr:tRNA (guanosine(37)-N1)-methyltransferase TrmD [Lachnospiraceae bacterium]
MNFHILTLFPEMVMQGLMTSITGRAVQQNKIGIEAVNIRDYTTDKHGKVDDYPYGGGAGMLMQAQPVYDACRSVLDRLPVSGIRRVIYVTPQGTPFTQKKAQELAKCDDLLILCGHYEGIDERVLEEVVTDYISIGDYVLTGGELAAMVIVDAVARLVPEVLNNEQSAETESFHGNLLEYPQYSRPEIWHDRAVPPVLLSGNQKEIGIWRKGQAVKRTKERRPDLYQRYETLEKCKNFLMRQKLLHIDMIECINRCRAEVIYWDGKELLLREQKSGVFFHTRENVMDLPAKPEEWKVGKMLVKEQKRGRICLVVHQEQMIPYVEQLLSLQVSVSCYQAVCTRKEKLPVRGLYRPDTMETVSGYVIKPLDMELLPQVVSNYDGDLSKEYFQNRIAEGQMKGVFCDGSMAGFIGQHDEGSIGMLQILPEHRGKKLAQVLETVMVNEALERGEIPYAQIRVENKASLSLQEKLGLCISKAPVYWMESV